MADLTGASLIEPSQEELEREAAARAHALQQKRQIVEGLREVLAALNSHRSLDSILDFIVEQACSLLGAAASSIFRPDEAGTFLTIRAARGLDEDYIASVEVPVGQGAVGVAAVTRQPVTIPDIVAAINESATFRLPDADRRRLARLARKYRALLSVPLIVGQEAYGAMSFYYPAAHSFSRDEVDLAMAFAEQAALAIENTRLYEQAQQAAALEERQRLARELHDSVTQTLFSASLIAEVLPRIWERNPDMGRERLQELRQLTRGALAEMRTLLLELRPSALTELTLDELLRHLADSVQGRARLPIGVEISGAAPGRLPPDAQVALYRIVQEALNNVVKHASARQARIEVVWGARNVQLAVVDEGGGFDPAGVPPGHLGLGSMHERAAGIGAVLDVITKPGQGTRVQVTWSSHP